MLIHERRYLETLHDMLREAREASVAVAFWGEGSESVFKQWDGKSLRIICNLAMGGTNPAVIPKLQALNGAEVRQLDDLHAKLVLTEKQMVVGSANMSCNGLGLESSEVAGLRELGILSRDARLRDKAKAWFDQLWKSAKTIRQEDLDLAKKAWAKRRKARPSVGRKGSGSLLDLPAEALKDREIYFAVYRRGLSSSAKERLEIENKRLTNSDKPEHDKLDLYEGWGADELPKDPNAVIIPIYWGARGKIKVDRAQRPVPELEDSYVDDNGEKWRLDFAAFVKDSRTLDLPFSFTPADRKELQAPIGDWLKSMNDRLEGDDAFCKSVYEFLRWRHRRRR